MSVTAAHPARKDGLTRTTLRIGAALSEPSLAAIVHALRRVPGVLTVDADADAAHAQAFIAHDSAVPIAALVVAVNRAGSDAKAIFAAGVAVASAAPDGVPQRMQRQPFMAAAGLAAGFAIIFIDITLANSPEKRWFVILPVVLLWAFVLLRATFTRRP